MPAAMVSLWGFPLRGSMVPHSPRLNLAFAAPPLSPSAVCAGSGAVAFAAPPFGPLAIGVGAGAGSVAVAAPPLDSSAIAVVAPLLIP